MLRNQVLTMFKHAVDTGTFNQVLRNVNGGEKLTFYTFFVNLM